MPQDVGDLTELVAAARDGDQDAFEQCPARQVVGAACQGRCQSIRLRDPSLDRSGLVVLNDSLTDGWSVKVDGRKATPVRVNSVMRGVVAGPGRHTIVWSYTTPGLTTTLMQVIGP